MTSRFVPPFYDVGSGVKPASGAKLFFFALDGVTPKDTYTTQAATTPNDNPVIADSVGVFPAIYITGDYLVTLKNKNDVQEFGLAPVSEFTTGDFETNLINDLSLPYEFPTVAAFKASLIEFPDGKTIRLLDRRADFTKISGQSGTGGRVIPSTSVNQSITLIIKDNIINMAQMGANNGADETALLLEALNIFRVNSFLVNGNTTYNAGTIFIPNGFIIKITADSIGIDDLMGLKFKGGGAILNNYFEPTRSGIRVIDDGLFGLKFSTDSARNVIFEDISIEYDSGFTGDLILSSNQPGFLFVRSNLTSSAKSGVRPVTAKSLFNAHGGHHFHFEKSTLSDAIDLVIADNATAVNTNNWSFDGCLFFDASNSHVITTGASVFGMSFVGCGFDPIQGSASGLNIQYSLDLSVFGLSITGVPLSGSNLDDAPEQAWLRFRDGNGSVSGNLLWGERGTSIIIDGGALEVSGNRFFCANGVKVNANGSVSGGGNRFAHQGAGVTDKAWDLSAISTSVISLEPDVISSGFQYSYDIGGGSSNSGQIYYSKQKDSSTVNFASQTGDIEFIPVGKRGDSATKGQLDYWHSRKLFITTSADSYTLPAVGTFSAGMEWTFHKKDAGNATITKGSGTNMYFGAVPVSSVSNATTEIGSLIKITASDNNSVIVESFTGTWT